MRILVAQPTLVSLRSLGIGRPGRGALRVMAMWEAAGDQTSVDHSASGKLLGQDTFWETVGEDCASFDQGLPKTCGEFLLSGTAHSEVPVADLGVMVRLGPVKKLLHVFGDRFWSGSRASTPVPFTEMPITWERALGGPDDHRNYVGRGEVADEQAEAVLLPNVELADDLVRGPKDRPAPAGFGPLIGAGLPRRKYLGTMDERWIDRRFPEMPLDFDPRFGQQASEDQWTRGFWTGDEAFELYNLRRGMPSWAGRLPGLRARAWVTRVRNVAPEEVPLVLDTVWFFPRHGRIALIWRGLFELEDDDELNVKDVMAALERIGESRSNEHYACAYDRRTAKTKGAGELEDDVDLLPPDLVKKPTALAGPAKPDPAATTDILEEMRVKLTSNLMAEQEKLRAEREALVAAGQSTQGIDTALEHMAPEKVWQQMLAGASAPPIDLSTHLAEQSAAIRAELVASGVSAQMIAEHDLAVAEAGVMAAQAAALKSEVARGAVGPPKLPTAAEQVDILAMLRAVKEQAGADYPAEIEEQIAAIEMPTFHRDLAEQEAGVRERYRASAHLQDTLTTLGPASSAARRAEVERATAAGESLHRWDLTALDLSGIDFRGADLSEAWLESANLSGAKLAGCNLQRAVLTRADLTKADLQDTDLTDANLGRVAANEANLTRAKLAGAICAGARFTEACLAGTELGSVDLSAAVLERVSFRDCKASLVTITDTDLSECDFRGADLAVGNFTDCRLHRADFRGAKLERTLFFSCQGEDVRFDGAKAFNMRFGKGEDEVSSFPRASFRDAMLERACLGDTNLAGADFRGSIANRAIFSSSDLTGARFDGVSLKETRFERAILREASFVCADLMDANLMRARVQGASFEHANLFGVNTLRLRLDERTNFRHANLEGVRFFQPIREVPAPKS